ncbi:hypothetical protein ZWY2020_012271 [Hordeum vulgare]|nr:hypothetical protein ZWY2020_012271 [Hordeum vulgare]
MAAAEGEKKITLKSSDGEEFDVDKTVVMESQTLRHMIEDECADNVISFPNVNSKILSKVIEYCKQHVQVRPKPADSTAANAAANSSTSAPAATPAPTVDMKSWDAEFIKVDQATLYDLILAANYLDIKGLLDLICQSPT